MPIIYESYAISEKKAVGAKKYPTVIACHLYRPDRTTPILPGDVFFVGSKISIDVFLQKEVDPALPWVTVKGTEMGATIKIYHRLNTGPWEKIFDGKPPDTHIWLDYTLAKAGTHTFYSEYPGDDALEGCAKAAKTFAR